MRPILGFLALAELIASLLLSLTGHHSASIFAGVLAGGLAFFAWRKN